MGPVHKIRHLAIRIPSALVFGEFPSLRTFEGPIIGLSKLSERAGVRLQARRYVAHYLAQKKIQRALRHNTPPATDHDYTSGDQVRVRREKEVEINWRVDGNLYCDQIRFRHENSNGTEERRCVVRTL